MFSNPFKRPVESEVEPIAPLLPAPMAEPVEPPSESLAQTDSQSPPVAIAPAQNSEFEIAPDEAMPAEPIEAAPVAPIEAPPIAQTDEKGSEPAVVRPLFIGAFLNGELEVVEVLERGPINFYRANAGDWGENDWKWVWERAATSPEPVMAPADLFFAPATRFVQDGREYAVYDFDERQPFSNWRAPANDDTFLKVIFPLAFALQALEHSGLKPLIAPDSLWFEAGEARFFGFCDVAQPDQPKALSSLFDLSSTLAKAHLAPRATLRLDDVWAALPFSLELKHWAGELESGTFASIEEARASLGRFAAPTQTQVHVQTDVGKEREHNEDGVTAVSLQRAGQDRDLSIELLAVADGMGGHEAGEVASQTALDTLQLALLQGHGNWNDNAELLHWGRELIARVNAAVIAQNEAPPFSALRQKPGTTLVFALRLGRRLLVGNVGDSRLYRWNQNSGLELLTKDHSYVQDLIDAGKLNPDDAWNHPDGSIITSHIGMTRGLLSDVTLRLVGQGDRVVLVSDGVVDTLRDSQIEPIVASAPDVRSLCSTLVDAANEAGGVDNISVVAMFCE